MKLIGYSSPQIKSLLLPARIPFLISPNHPNNRPAQTKPACLLPSLSRQQKEILECSIRVLCDCRSSNAPFGLASIRRKKQLALWPLLARLGLSQKHRVGIQPLETVPPESQTLRFQFHAPSPKAHPQARSHTPQQARPWDKTRISHYHGISSPANARAIHPDPLSNTTGVNRNATTRSAESSDTFSHCSKRLSPTT